jgi:hypothetical protein
MLTTNLSYNRPMAIQGVIVQGWIREIARVLTIAVSQNAVEVDLEGLELPANFWIAPPDLIRPFRQLKPEAQILPVVDAVPTGFAEDFVGYFLVPPQFQAKSREFFSRWETKGQLEYSIWVNPAALRPLSIAGVAYDAQVL